MNRLLLIMMFVCCLPSGAQNTLTSMANMIRVGDSLQVSHIAYYDARNGGEGQVWDVSQSDIRGQSLLYYIGCQDTCILGIGNKSVLTYELHDDSLLQTRYENPLLFIQYKKPRLSMHYPFQYGAQTTNEFYGEGKYCGRYYQRCTGTEHIEADGEGTLILSEGDTLSNVLRVHTIQSSAWRVNLDSLQNDEDTGQQEIRETYRWYARGYRYPLLETIVSTYYDNLNPIASQKTTYKYRLVTKDALNEDVLESDSIEEDRLSNPVFHYQLSYNNNRISIDYSLTEQAHLQIIVADIMGVMHYHHQETHEAGEGYHLEVDCSALRRGKYVVYINVNGEVYSNKIEVK